MAADVSEPGDAPRKRRLSLRRIVIGAGVVIIVVLAVAAWIAVRGLQARHHLLAVKAEVARLRNELLTGQDARATMSAIQHNAQAAYDETHDPVWALTSFAPPVQTVRGLSSVASLLARQALPPLVRVGPSVAPKRLRIRGDTLALDPLRAAAPALGAADHAVRHALDSVQRLPGGWFGVIGRARTEVIDQLSTFSGSIDDAYRFAEVAPSMFGADGVRHYFIGVQNNAESRGTGGLVAAWVLLKADRGHLTVVRQGNDVELRPPTAQPVVNFGPDFQRMYGSFGTPASWSNSNMSGHFPYAAAIWAGLFREQFGVRIDGAIGIDPVTMAGILRVTGPATVKQTGEQINTGNVVDFAERTEYERYPNPGTNAARRVYLQHVASAVIDKVLSGAGDARGLASALAGEAGSGHLQVWSAHPAEQRWISGTPIAGEIPDTPGPFAALVVDNAAGTKLDYYLNQSLNYTSPSCSEDPRRSTITVLLTNNAPLRGLPAYVRLRPDIHPHNYVEKSPQNHVFAFVYATRGARLLDATLDGRPVDVTSGQERGHSLYLADLLLDPEKTVTLKLDLVEPAVKGAPTTKAQPLVRPIDAHFDVASC